MSEICKWCGSKMTLEREYKDDGFQYYEHRCGNEDCERKKIYQVCNNCEHEISWWED